MQEHNKQLRLSTVNIRKRVKLLFSIIALSMLRI
jgi:hypothetical protein